MSEPGTRFTEFCRVFLRQSKGRWAGQPLLLEPWQQELVDELLREENGRRVYREALIGVPRKNGKSTLAGVLLAATPEAIAALVSPAHPRWRARPAAGGGTRVVAHRARPQLL